MYYENYSIIESKIQGDFPLTITLFHIINSNMIIWITNIIILWL